MLIIEKLLFDESSLEILLELDKPGVITRDPLGVKIKLFLSLFLKLEENDRSDINEIIQVFEKLFDFNLQPLNEEYFENKFP